MTEECYEQLIANLEQILELAKQDQLDRYKIRVLTNVTLAGLEFNYEKDHLARKAKKPK